MKYTSPNKLIVPSKSGQLIENRIPSKKKNGFHHFTKKQTFDFLMESEIVQNLSHKTGIPAKLLSHTLLILQSPDIKLDEIEFSMKKVFTPEFKNLDIVDNESKVALVIDKYEGKPIPSMTGTYLIELKDITPERLFGELTQFNLKNFQSSKIKEILPSGFQYIKIKDTYFSKEKIQQVLEIIENSFRDTPHWSFNNIKFLFGSDWMPLGLEVLEEYQSFKEKEVYKYHFVLAPIPETILENEDPNYKEKTLSLEDALFLGLPKGFKALLAKKTLTEIESFIKDIKTHIQVFADPKFLENYILKNYPEIEERTIRILKELDPQFEVKLKEYTKKEGYSIEIFRKVFRNFWMKKRKPRMALQSMSNIIEMILDANEDIFSQFNTNIKNQIEEDFNKKYQ